VLSSASEVSHCPHWTNPPDCRHLMAVPNSNMRINLNWKWDVVIYNILLKRAKHFTPTLSERFQHILLYLVYLLSSPFTGPLLTLPPFPLDLQVGGAQPSSQWQL